MVTANTVVRQPAELRWAEELAALAANDGGPRPAGWKLSPRAVRTFVCGSDGAALEHVWHGERRRTTIERKFFGDDVLVERVIVGLTSSRGVLLVGEPGTAKSLLSELLAAAVSGTSLDVVQGTAATTEDHIRYSWNYALLLAEGPTRRALVPSPLYEGMSSGKLVRFEELTRCPPEVQDTLVGILSEKLMTVPELAGDERVVFARPGFNVLATANLRDRGVHEMSSALKRRFNFETVEPIRSLDDEIELVSTEVRRQLGDQGIAASLDRDVASLLVTTFHDLRRGITSEGIRIEKPSTVLSTAEAVAVGLSAALDAHYYRDGVAGPDEIARHVAGAVLKENAEDLARLRHYFDVVVQRRARESQGAWEAYYRARKWLP